MSNQFILGTAGIPAYFVDLAITGETRVWSFDGKNLVIRCNTCAPEAFASKTPGTSHAGENNVIATMIR